MAIGSVFLGDVQRHRLLSSGSSTPPSSPPPSSSAMAAVFRTSSTSPTLQKISDDIVHRPSSAHSPRPLPDIDPMLSLELRLRWLEALLVGIRHDSKDKKGKEKAPELSHNENLLRLAEEVQLRLRVVVESNESLKRFIENYDQYAHLLTPSFALSGSLASPQSSYEDMSTAELEAFLVEMESDIRAADRDMREIEYLESRGVTGAGKLADYESLKPRLSALLKAHEEDLELAASLERRIASLMEKHATQVDALSELFVDWDEAVTVGEDQINKLERDKQERSRLGFE